MVAFEAEGSVRRDGTVVERRRARVATHPERRRFDSRGLVDIAIGVDEVSGREVLDTADPMAPAVTSALARW